MKKITLVILLFALIFSLKTINAQKVAKNYVVVEIVTGTWCYYCPGAAMGADDLVENGHQVAVIEHHSGDSYQTTGSSARSSYYNVSGIPDAYFNGTYNVSGGSHTSSMYTNYLSAYNQAIDDLSDFTLDLDFTNTGLDYQATIEVTEPGSYSGTNLVVHLALTESHIPENWQGMSELNFVNRAMYPNHSGSSYSGGTETFNINFSADASWVIENCELVAFIQDNDTKEILQSDKISLATPTGTNNAALQEIYEIDDKCENKVSPVVKIKNYGSDDITSLTFEYSVNSGTTETYNWTGSAIAYTEETDIELDEITFNIQQSNTLDIEITQVNGTSDDDPANNSASIDFDQSPQAVGALHLELNTYSNGSECTWEITTYDGTVIYEGGPYQNNQTIEEDIYLGNDCYKFSLMDSGGDGGSTAKLKDDENNTICLIGGSYGSGQTEEFGSEGTAPMVSFIPIDGQTGVDTDIEIKVKFNQPVRLPNDDPITDPAALITLVDEDNNDVSFTAEINDAKKKITVTPVDILDTLTEYTVSILAGSIENQFDIALEEDESSTFKTNDQITQITRIKEKIKIYPNPASLEVNITNVHNSTIEIYSILGEKIYSHKSKSNIYNLNISNFDSGNYIIKIIKNNITISKKLTIIK